MRHTIILVLLLLIAVGAVFVTLVAYHPAPQTRIALAEASQAQADLKSDRLPAKKPATPLVPTAERAERDDTSGALETPPRAPAPEFRRPSFELVRIEPDGSAVVAGKAEPEVKVELIVGSRVVGETTAGSDGNFAIVLDEPLQPGDYQLVLRATAPGNVAVMSVGKAIVSVPVTTDGEAR